MSSLVVQLKAKEKEEQDERADRAAHEQAVLDQQSYEHENLHKTFGDKYELFRAERESSNLDAREHALAVREEMQEIVDKFRDRDRPCHLCVFGLMGHGKSRFINLMLTALSKEPSVHGVGGAESTDKVVAVDEVPSGSGSTTRSYARYMMPIASSQGGGRFMFYVVDTIGVKFSDEFNPSRQVRSTVNLSMTSRANGC